MTKGTNDAPDLKPNEISVTLEITVRHEVMDDLKKELVARYRNLQTGANPFVFDTFFEHLRAGLRHEFYMLVNGRAVQAAFIEQASKAIEDRVIDWL